MIPTSLITYRTADPRDIISIAELHTASWQLNYRDIWSAEYLDHLCLQERQETWTDRLSKPADNQYVIVAHDGKRLVGFGCGYIGESERYGSLLDNIHVAASHQGCGVGTSIMHRIASYARQQSDDLGIYLWVLTANVKSLHFYKNLSGVPQEGECHVGPVGIKADATKVVWSQCSYLEKACCARSKP